MEVVAIIYANKYNNGQSIVHLEERDAISNASEGAEQIPIECIDPQGSVKVYFETKGYAELVAIFDDEKMYLACLPALEELANKDGFTKVTESIQ